MKTTHLIPTNEPILDGNEKKYVLETLDSNWISIGKKTAELEEKFAEYVGTKYAVACTSGTTAIHLSLTALDIGPGDEVIIPDFNIIVSARMILITGAKPVLVDVDKYWCIDPGKIEEKITKRTRAIIPVHIYGNPANMDEIMKIARKHKLFVIEDACAAHGAQVNEQKVGSIGNLGCFSLYTSKTVIAGEGGIVTTNDKKLADKIYSLRNQGFGLENRFRHEHLGFNYRVTDLQSAIALAQVEQIDKKVQRKRDIAKNYQDLLQNIKEIEPHSNPPWGKSGFWMYGIVLKDSFGRTPSEVKYLLKERGIGSEYFFTPMSKQKIFIKGDSRFSNFPDIRGEYPMSNYFSDRGLYLPTGLGITRKTQKLIIKNLLDLRR